MSYARITTYPQRGKDGTDLRCIRGPIAAVQSVAEMQLKTTPKAFIRYEQINRRLDEAYIEIEIPREEDTVDDQR